MYKFRHLALATAFIASTSLTANDTPPEVVVPNCPVYITIQNVEEFAKNGESKVGDQKYNLVSLPEDQANQHYHGHLFQNKNDLKDWFFSLKSHPTVTLNVNSHQNARKRDHLRTHCAYDLEWQDTIKVIAIRPAGEETKSSKDDTKPTS